MRTSPTADRATLAAALREVLLAPGEAAGMEVHGRTDAAVLIPVSLQADGLHAVFTKRRDDLRKHPGEISFPGGRMDPGDPDLAFTALRETEEEIGLPRDAVELVGALPPTPTFVTSYAIYPFVGIIEPGREWTLSPNEVEVVLDLPLRAVRDGRALERMVRRGMPFRTETYTVDGRRIWGATARIVGDLLMRVGPLLG